MSSAQVGKSELLLNTVGYHIHLDPAPMLMVQPTLELAEAFSKDRLTPMVRDTPCLKGKLKDAKSKDSNNTLLHKKFPGGQITLAGANSAASLASRPVRIVLCDEVDRYPVSAGAEGDPISLAKKRAATFFNRKYISTSTPTIKNHSRIETAYLASDMRKYQVPCPHCDHYQVLIWGQLKWVEGNPSSATYECSSCRKPIEEHHKLQMLKVGKWIAEQPFKGIAGFHLSELYSPWRKWSEMVVDFLAAKESPEMLKAWVNTSLGEAWEQKGDAPDWKRLYERREKYQIGSVPTGVAFLTAGVDVQKDRIEIQVKGWGRGKESWSIDNEVIPGDTSTPEPWQKLSQFLEKTYSSSDERNFPIRTMAVDSGFNTQEVYNWCRQYPYNRVIAVKGRENSGVLLGAPSSVDLTVNGRRIRRGFKVWIAGVNIAKSELFGWLRQERPIEGEIYPPGYCHFPEYDKEFFEQLTAEHLVRKKTTKGYFTYVWEKTRERNEALDTTIYNRIAAAAVGIDRFKDRDWEALGLKAEPNEKPVEKQVQAQPQRKEIKRRKSNYW